MPKLNLKPTDFVEFYDGPSSQWLRGTVIEIEKKFSDVVLDSGEPGRHLTVAVLLEDGELKDVKYRTGLLTIDDIKIVQRVG